MKIFRFLIPVLATAFLISLFAGTYASANTAESNVDVQVEEAVAESSEDANDDSLESYEVPIHRGILEQSL